MSICAIFKFSILLARIDFLTSSKIPMAARARTVTVDILNFQNQNEENYIKSVVAGQWRLKWNAPFYLKTFQ